MNPSRSMGNVLKLTEAAEYVRVSERTLREMARSGRVPCQRVGREWRFLRKALDEWLIGNKPAADGSGAVAEPSQMYLPTLERVPEFTETGFGDTAFTKNREEPMHRWVPWIAGFSASFVGEILDRELDSSKAGKVLDPFAGVGTTLIESLRRNRDVVGFEINPYAALACQVKIEALRFQPRSVRKLAHELESYLRSRLRDGSAAPRSAPPTAFRTHDPFFSPAVERQVLVAKDFIAEQQQDGARRLLRLALGSVMVGMSNYSYEPSLGRRIAAGKKMILDADVAGILRDKLLHMALDLEILQRSLPETKRQPTAQVFNESYLEFGAQRLGIASVDVLVTSPPYLNNYHYVRNTRPHMFWLDFVTDTAELHELEASSFGKFWQTVRSEPDLALAFSYPDLEVKLRELRSVNSDKGPYGGPGWANYAVTYFNDCARFCEVTAQIMKPGGLVVVVIGNNILQGIEFKTDEIFAHIAQKSGFEIQGLHRVRKKRTGSSIVNSSVRVGITRKKTELYETAVELRRISKAQ
mgnify:CR=1 FL=1